MDLFSSFPATDYTFLEIEQGVSGNTIKSEHPSTGIVKLREGMRQTGYGELHGQGLVQSSSTVHIRATEPFLALVGKNTVGHGVRISKNGSNPEDYRIIGQSEGYDFDSGEIAFYKVSLKREDIATWQVSDLPLS